MVTMFGQPLRKNSTATLMTEIYTTFTVTFKDLNEVGLVKKDTKQLAENAPKRQLYSLTNNGKTVEVEVYQIFADTGDGELRNTT